MFSSLFGKKKRKGVTNPSFPDSNKTDAPLPSQQVPAEDAKPKLVFHTQVKRGCYMFRLNADDSFDVYFV